MTYDFGSFNEWGVLRQVAIRAPEHALQSDAKIDREWQDLNWHSRPDFSNANSEYAGFATLLKSVGAELIHLPAADGLTLDALYARDALVITPKGLVKPRMGKAQRRQESNVNGAALEALGVAIAGEITGDGKLEGGDLIWLDRHTLLAGVGYRTNTEGVRQLQKFCGDSVEVLWFDPPEFATAEVALKLHETIFDNRRFHLDVLWAASSLRVSLVILPIPSVGVEIFKNQLATLAVY